MCEGLRTISLLIFVMDIETTRGAIRDYLDRALADPAHCDSKTLEAARYMVLNDFSKLYRPLLLLATAEGYSVSHGRAMPIAAAIEAIHVSSLIEDDKMDESDTRRGKPACHIVYGEEIAHLAHMRLREFAEEHITERNSLSLKQRNAIARLAFRTGNAMIYGQEKDVLQRDLDSLEKVLRMYEGKTGALIGAALASGGIVGKACQEDIDNLYSMGVNMGVSYQIIDDALDSRASTEETGKPANQDLKKQTLVKLVGWDEVKRIKCEKDKEIDRLFATLHGDHSILGDFVCHLRGKHERFLSSG